MGNRVLHQSHAPGRIGAIFARGEDPRSRGKKVGNAGGDAEGHARRVRADLLYLKIRRGTQVAQGRGLQNLHSWVRIPPAPPTFIDFPLQTGGPAVSFKLNHFFSFVPSWVCDHRLEPKTWT